MGRGTKKVENHCTRT